jgi:hypothetical protein
MLEFIFFQKFLEKQCMSDSKGFEVLTAVFMKSILWDMRAHSPLKGSMFL